MKKVIRLALSAMILIALMGVLFMGCGGDSAGGGSTDRTTATNTISDDPVTLRLMAYNSESSRPTYLKFLEDSLPNIKITYEYVNLDNFSNVLNSQLLAGQGPDLIEVGGETKLLAKADYLYDLTSESFRSKYSEPGFAAYTVDGKYYATPMQSWFEGIFYNKKIFRENGISVPKTLDEFIQVHKDLAEKGIKPQTMGAQSWEPMMKQSIGVVNNEFYAKEGTGFDAKFDKGETKLADAWLPAVTEWYKVIEEGCLTQDMLGLSYEQAMDEFATGNAAMWESGPWAYNDIMDRNPDFELGMFPIPGVKEGPGWLVGGPGSGLAINADSKNLEAALQVLDKSATPEAQIALLKDNPGSTSFLVGVDADLGDTYTDCADAFKAANVYAPWTSVWTAGNPIVEGYGKSLQEVLAGTKTIEQALKDADDINDQMRESME